MIKSEIQAYFTNDYFIIFRNNTSNDIWHSATPSTSPLSILFSQSLIAVVNSFRTRHQSCFNSLYIDWGTLILPTIILVFFWHNTYGVTRQPVSPFTSPPSILFGQSLIAVVNSFWMTHQSSFNSFSRLRTHLYLYLRFYFHFSTQHIRQYSTIRPSVYIAAANFIHSLIDSGCQ